MTIELDPSKVSPTTHTFIGYFRPPFSDPKRFSTGFGAKYECPRCGWRRNESSFSMNQHDKLACHSAGHFDIPQYRVIEEACDNVKSDTNPTMTAMRAAITAGARGITLSSEAFDRLLDERERFRPTGVIPNRMHFYGVEILRGKPDKPKESGPPNDIKSGDRHCINKRWGRVIGTFWTNGGTSTVNFRFDGDDHITNTWTESIFRELIGDEPHRDSLASITKRLGELIHESEHKFRDDVVKVDQLRPIRDRLAALSKPSDDSPLEAL